MIMATIKIGEYTVLILQPTIPSDWRVSNRGKGTIWPEFCAYSCKKWVDICLTGVYNSLEDDPEALNNVWDEEHDALNIVVCNELSMELCGNSYYVISLKHSLSESQVRASLNPPCRDRQQEVRQLLSVACCWKVIYNSLFRSVQVILATIPHTTSAEAMNYATTSGNPSIGVRGSFVSHIWHAENLAIRRRFSFSRLARVISTASSI